MSAEYSSSAGLSDLNSPIDVQSVMRRIRKQARGSDPEHEWLRQGRRAVPSHLISNVARLRSSTALLRSSIARIGEQPPAPRTIRGKIGFALVQVVRRALFWLIPTIRTAQGQLVDALEGQLAATEEILKILQQTHAELARIDCRNIPSAPANGVPAKSGTEHRSEC
ncbi:MAG: hypothetical protein H7Y20_05070 [Bryobacteraceae bacterium]|nr:hypothetical protein [Bryobacteraceae bacterium]